MSKMQQGKIFTIATDLVSAVCVGLILGFYLDKWLETKPLFIIIGIIIGIAAAFKMIYKEIQKN